jgi:hypothetical protein
MEVHRADGDVGGLGDLVDRGPLDALGEEQLAGGVEDRRDRPPCGGRLE